MKITNSVVKILSILLFIAAATACQNTTADQNKEQRHYIAIHKNDTATFNIKLGKKDFYGQFEINYHGAFKDSGGVTGIVKGDTLKGSYRFQHYGIEKWHTRPIALLKKGDKLIMGQGDMEIFMNIFFFKRNTIIDYKNPRFVFELKKE